MEKNEQADIAARRRMTMRLSLIMIALCTLAAAVAAHSARKEKTPDLWDFSGANLDDYESRYLENGSTEDLISLLKVLCFQSETGKNDKLSGKIALYGTELLRRAKEREVDLMELDKEDETLLSLLRLIRKYGAS